MPRKPSAKGQRKDPTKKAPGNRKQKNLPLLSADQVKGGVSRDGSFDPGTYFKTSSR